MQRGARSPGLRLEALSKQPPRGADLVAKVKRIEGLRACDDRCGRSAADAHPVRGCGAAHRGEQGLKPTCSKSSRRALQRWGLGSLGPTAGSVLEDEDASIASVRVCVFI